MIICDHGALTTFDTKTRTKEDCLLQSGPGGGATLTSDDFQHEMSLKKWWTKYIEMYLKSNLHRNNGWFNKEKNILQYYDNIKL